MSPILMLLIFLGKNRMLLKLIDIDNNEMLFLTEEGTKAINLVHNFNK